MNAVDYIVADATLIPPGDDRFYTEKVVRLPGSYLFAPGVRPIAATPSRTSCDLPTDAFVFCGFNRTQKITPMFFAIWMRLLRAVRPSVLWLSGDNPLAMRNLKSAAATQGVDPERVIFAPRLPMAEHLARHRVADLFLDTLPYNAHTTMVDALEAGLPAITCLGKCFAGRGGASLLRAAGLEDLVTATPAAYEAQAHTLAADPDVLAAVRQRVQDAKGIAALFGRDAHVRHLETAYMRMMDLHRAGRAPESFSV